MNKSSSYRNSRSGYGSTSSQEKENFFPKSPIQQKEDPFFQAKLQIGDRYDKYEKEADSVADKVVSKKDMDEEPGIQRQEIQSIQRLSTPLEDESFSTNDQRMRRDREIREKPEVQLKCSNCEGEEKHQKEASPSLTSRLESNRGKGDALPTSTLYQMESSFGANFRDVNIHTDAESVNMNRELGAQAFTHGKDIYFNSGKFNPYDNSGRHLIAHELTHVVQQEKDTVQTKPIQRKPAPDKKKSSAPPKATPVDNKPPQLTAIASDVYDDHCGALQYFIEWDLSKDAGPAGGYIIQEVTIVYSVFNKQGLPISREEKSGMHYYEAWRVLPNSKEIEPGASDKFTFDIHAAHGNSDTVGTVVFKGVAHYHDNVSPDDMPSHMVSGNQHTVAGLLLSSTHDPKLGGNISAPVAHELAYHWNCADPKHDHSNIIDTQIPGK